MQLNRKNLSSSEEKRRNALNPDLGAKPQVWHHWL